MIEILIILGLVWIILAVVQDLKSREVANWLNFSLIIFALAVRLFYSVFTNNYDYILFGIFGLAVFFVLGHLFYYIRVFAGGDAKLMIALGTIIPFANSFYENILVFFIFTIALLVAGALYSIIYSGVLVLQNQRVFQREFRKLFDKNKGLIMITFLIAVFLILFPLFTGYNQLLIICVLIFVFPYFYIYLKAVENACLVKKVSVKELTIGDWLVKDVQVGNKVISSSWEGLSESDLNYIKKKYKKKVLIKNGIPFTPSFLIAFLVLIAIQYLGHADWGFWQFF